jgi:NADH-quinone oxidoreductase subunit H
VDDVLAFLFPKAGPAIHPAVFGAIIVLGVVPGTVSFLVWCERRISAWIQDRLGPNRVGPLGLLQSIADLVKFLFKEDVVPGHVNKPLYFLAPILGVVPYMIVFAFLPFGERLWVANVDTGILAIFAFSSVAVYALALGGWASNSKYPLIGGVRASAQMISYELCLSLSALGVFLMAGSLNLVEVVHAQADGLQVGGTLQDGLLARIFDWNIWSQPVGGLIFLVAGFAETNRLPFDMPEAESELAAGYHTEYSSMKFALFFLGEYAAMIAISTLFATLYLGGWTLFGAEHLMNDVMADTAWANQVITAVWHSLLLGGKVFTLLFLFIQVRWTLPRFRYDQLMTLGWRTLLPVSLLWVALFAVVFWMVR